MVTVKEIEAAKTAEGGWSRQQLAQWGISWPPPKGWKERLLQSEGHDSDAKDPDRLKAQQYCKGCGRLSFVPCEDCDGDVCSMNCGPGMVDVRAIIKAAIEEYEAIEKLDLLAPDERMGMRSAVRGIMVRLGLYDNFTKWTGEIDEANAKDS